MNPPNLQNLVGVVQLILGSSSACAWVMEDDRWTLIPNSEAEGDGLCQVLYYRKFQAGEHPPYRFRWFTPLTYDVRTYVISNVSGVDVASNNSGSGTTLARSEDTTMFVSRGVGTVYVPVRINCPPEVAVLTLQPAEA